MSADQGQNPDIRTVIGVKKKHLLHIFRCFLLIVLLVAVGFLHKTVIDPALASIHSEWFWSVYNSIDFLTIPLFAFGCITPVVAGIILEAGSRLWGAPTMVEIGCVTSVYVLASWLININIVFLRVVTLQNIPTIFVLIFSSLFIVHLIAVFISKQLVGKE